MKSMAKGKFITETKIKIDRKFSVNEIKKNRRARADKLIGTYNRSVCLTNQISSIRRQIGPSANPPSNRDVCDASMLCLCCLVGQYNFISTFTRSEE